MLIPKKLMPVFSSVKSLQKTINKTGELGVRLIADGIYGKKTSAGIIKIQDLYMVNKKSEPRVKLNLVTIKTDTLNGTNYPIILRSDMAERLNYNARRYTGHIHSSGGIRRLGAKVSNGRIATSLHYLGRAFDLNTQAGMVDPKTDPYIVISDPDNRGYFRVYGRGSGKNIRSDRTVRSYEPGLTAWTYDVKKRRRVIVQTSGYFGDLTTVFGLAGFLPIPPRKSFLNGTGSWIGAEWWHFQNIDGLIPGETTFGSELRLIYPLSKLRGTAPWKYRNLVWNGSSFGGLK